MKPIRSLPSNTQGQGNTPGKKKSGAKKQFHTMNSPGNSTGQAQAQKPAAADPITTPPVTPMPGPFPGPFSQTAPRTEDLKPRRTTGTLKDWREGELAKINTHKTPTVSLTVEQAQTIEMRPVLSSPLLPQLPAKPVSPKSTRPLTDSGQFASQPLSMPGVSLPISGYGQFPAPTPSRPLTMPPVMQGMQGMAPQMSPTSGMYNPIMSGPAGPAPLWAQQGNLTHGLSKKKVLLLIALLFVIVVQGITLPHQFLGGQGWATVLGTSQQNNDLLSMTPRGQGTGTAQTRMTPQQYIDSIISRMSLDQKLGQMMMVQFNGPIDSLELDTMISQYNVGAVLLFVSNGNITSDGEQLKTLTSEIQGKSELPLTIATDQEGGEVDRMAPLSGPSASAEEIGATHDPAKATESGKRDANHLATYGINLNLAPVVDVNTLPSAIVSSEARTYSSDPAEVAQMAGAYLQGLQESGKVLGTLKHFPGLGGVSGDPHQQLTYLNRSRAELDSIDWAPYRTLIAQGKVHVIMVTHTYVTSIDANNPASLSPKVQEVLRKDMHYEGVLLTDSLQMAGVSLSPQEAAKLAVEAGSDMIMGASSPDNVAQMINGIKQAVMAGEITTQRIDESVRRILMMKYAGGLLLLPKR